MIEAGLVFEKAVGDVVDAFESLPTTVRPIHFSKNETPDNRADLVRDGPRLSAFVAKYTSGFFLLGPTVTYSIRVAAGQPIVCDCFMDVGPVDAEEFCVHMARGGPLFGYGCVSEERAHRNRVVLGTGDQSVECWVGRDSSKYLPGLYWLTLVSDALATKHGVAKHLMKAAAEQHTDLGNGVDLYRFFERPEHWADYAVKIDGICASTPGIFSIKDVRPQLANVDSLVDVAIVVSRWH